MKSRGQCEKCLINQYHFHRRSYCRKCWTLILSENIADRDVWYITISLNAPGNNAQWGLALIFASAKSISFCECKLIFICAFFAALLFSLCNEFVIGNDLRTRYASFLQNILFTSLTFDKSIGNFLHLLIVTHLSFKGIA